MNVICIVFTSVLATALGCNPKFTCIPDEPQSYEVRNSKHQCPAGMTCNDGYQDSCDPCIILNRDVCGFACKNAERGYYIFTRALLPFTCSPDTICNENYDSCDACIPKALPPAQSTPLPTPKPTYPPNCNDGLSADMPCRPGRKGSKIYYLCRKISGQGEEEEYDYETKLCQNISTDSECSLAEGDVCS